MRINVKNVGEAKSLLSKNGIRVTSSKYTNKEPNNQEGYVETDDSEATFLLRSMGIWRP